MKWEGARGGNGKEKRKEMGIGAARISNPFAINFYRTKKKKKTKTKQQQEEQQQRKNVANASWIFHQKFPNFLIQLNEFSRQFSYPARQQKKTKSKKQKQNKKDHRLLRKLIKVKLGMETETDTEYRLKNMEK